jgi:hypothetical protein
VLSDKDVHLKKDPVPTTQMIQADAFDYRRSATTTAAIEGKVPGSSKPVF